MATKKVIVTEDPKINAVRNAVIHAINTKAYRNMQGEREFDVSGRTCIESTIYVAPVPVAEGSSSQYSPETRKHEPVLESWLAIAGFTDVDGKNKVRIFLASNTVAGFTICWMYKRKDQSLYSKVTYTDRNKVEQTVPLTRGAIDVVATAAFPAMVEAAVAANPWMAEYLLPQPVAVETVIPKEILSHLTD